MPSGLKSNSIRPCGAAVTRPVNHLLPILCVCRVASLIRVQRRTSHRGQLWCPEAERGASPLVSASRAETLGYKIGSPLLAID